ncbi:MAG: IS4/IS5 family transposase, partial [Cellulosilyticaceae bacterium]
MHLNARYDIKNKLYVDAILQPGRKENENRALTDMIDRSKIKKKVIIMADRGYEAYNAFAHTEEKGAFDEEVNIIVTRKQTKSVKEKPELYKFVSKKGTFDFVDLHKNMFYPMTFRVVRFKITEDTYQT